MERQIAAIYAVVNGYLDDVSVSRVRQWEHGFLGFVESRFDDVFVGLRQEGKLTEEIEARLRESIAEYNKVFEAEEPPTGAGAD